MTEHQRLLPRDRPRSRARTPKQRYAAFISYAHEDEACAAWLHEALECFRVPPQLVGRLTKMGAIPQRLTPVFRDRHELAASDDLGEEIEDAIAGSRFLIVLCSPAAAASVWTNKEIDSFKRRHGEERVLALINDGEPGASAMHGREGEECFPPALRVRYDKRGRPTTQPAEPIAADLRAQGDGRRLALLKIIAGMLGVGLDDLAQRDAHRRHRRMFALTAASLAGMLVTSGLAVTAIRARDAAREERRQAEGLVGFMLGDLRRKLEPLGRLDVLDSVGTRALAFYARQDKRSLSDDSLAQRSRALTLLGELAQTRGDMAGALTRYAEAKATTAELLRRRPDDPQRLFDHAQNVYWTGYLDEQRGDLDQAIAAMRDYRRLAAQMVQRAPGKPEYQLEVVYADTNLGTMLMRGRHYREAADTYQNALNQSEQLAAAQPGSQDAQEQVSGALGWLAEAREFGGEFDEARLLRERETRLAQQLWARSKGDMSFRRDELAARAAHARILAALGDSPAALKEYETVNQLGAQLLKTDPSNSEWQQAIVTAATGEGTAALVAGDLARAADATRRACSGTDGLVARDRSVAAWRTTFRAECLRLRGALAERKGDHAAAADSARAAILAWRSASSGAPRAMGIAQAEARLGQALTGQGRLAEAGSALARAMASWPRGVEERPDELATKALLLRASGQEPAARQLAARLAAMGYRRADFLARWQQGSRQ
ncbi:TIR domain-containing protein [Sphingomonas ginkgonis]|uniref:TIR domain-containing protein n=1 Tax=Sphingomonas ginkgonis TaxID=2315330 RepID=A0A429V6Q2_9SPHN|nr:toll/interleukin-1 receptor domain-containing protein [Sphingomonas ginkgonis]RST29611.1 TIR domain-containing protein [Sphingomonas ginkgonis]